MSKRVPSDPAPDYFDNGKQPLPAKKAVVKRPGQPDRSGRTHHRLKKLKESESPSDIPDDAVNPYDSPAPRDRTHWDLD